MDYLNKIGEPIVQRNRMRESCSYGSVGERGGNEPLYPEEHRLAKQKTNHATWNQKPETSPKDPPKEHFVPLGNLEPRKGRLATGNSGENFLMNKMKYALVCGAGGFIGGHLVGMLKREGFWIRGVDVKHHEYMSLPVDDFVIGDLRDPYLCRDILDRPFDEVYQLAADMGGAGYIFTGEHDADVMHNSALINLNMTYYGIRAGIKKIFYSSSACIYPEYNQMDPDNPKCAENSAYPASPDSEYGWEKLFSERMYLAFHKNYNLDIRIARFHNVFGPYGAWNNGKEKAPAALCRKVAMAENGGEIEIWGDGKQTRSFLYIDECLIAMRKFMDSDFTGPVNIGSEEMVTINKLAELVMKIAEKNVTLRHIPGPLGVRGRKSDNRLIREKLGWAPSEPLEKGLERTYSWIEEQVRIEAEAGARG